MIPYTDIGELSYLKTEEPNSTRTSNGLTCRGKGWQKVHDRLHKLRKTQKSMGIGMIKCAAATLKLSENRSIPDCRRHRPRSLRPL